MARYRKEPIEAVQFTGRNPGAISAWIFGKVLLEEAGPEDTDGLSYIEIQTLEGTMRADVGDWIIRGVTGEVYSVKPGIFEATYELREV